MLLAVVTAASHAVGERQWEERGLALLGAWAVFCAAANVLPVPTIRNVALSMSYPVNVAIAYLFPPGIAAAVVFVASVTEWELKGETTLLHAVFNRAQLASATALASMVFAGQREAVPAALTVVGVVAVYQSANLLFVGLAEWSARGVPLVRVLRGLVPSGVAAAGTYLALGLVGLVLALTSVEIGTWAVPVLMLPLIVLRQALKASRELERAERERRALADRLIDERERERVRIASDIHDVVLQELAALQLSAESVGAALEHDRPEVAVRVAGQLRTGAGEVIAQLRGTIASLRRASMDDAGFAATLERFTRTFRSSTGINVTVDARGVDDLPLPVALLLFECCQEALTNVARHANASTARVRAEREGATVQLVVRDDGDGFSPKDRGGGSGLALSTEKVELAGGLLFVESRRGHGTTVTVRVPVGAE